MAQGIPTPAAEAGADDEEIALLQALLDRLPPPLQPPDVSALDGYLCGVLLQPNKVREGEWLPWVFDIEGRPPPPSPDAGRVADMVRGRATFLGRAIVARQWFDPWVFELEGQTSVAESMLPWVAGFAAAMEHFPGLMRIDDPQMLEPLALLYMHFDGEDLDDAEALLGMIELLEPPQDLGEAVQDIVRSVMLMADVVHPVGTRPGQRRARRMPAARRRR